jgi:hypothetical protein
MYDPIARGLALLDAEAPKKGIEIRYDDDDPRRRTYIVPTGGGRTQTVWATPVADPLFRERLDLITISVRNLQADQPLLLGLLAVARDMRRARLCVFDRETSPHLGVVASFVPEEIGESNGPRLLHALREVAAVADAIEAQLIGVDVS